MMIFVAFLFTLFLPTLFAADPCRFEYPGKGVIDISSLGRNDGQPLYENRAPLIESDYRYSYNPCKPFNEGGFCENVAACQVKEDLSHVTSLGSQKSAVWSAGLAPGENPSITYSEDQRKLIVKLECSTSGMEEFVVEGEPSENLYVFRLTHQCACWNGCSRTPTTTTTTTAAPTSLTPVSNACRYEHPGKGVIDFSFIGRTDERAAYTDEPTRTFSHYVYSYNPCRPFSEGSLCIGVAACQISTNGKEVYAIGSQDSATWSPGSGENAMPSVNYTYGERRAIVFLQCSPEGNNEFQAFGEDPLNTFRFQLTHRCACWNGCA